MTLIESIREKFGTQTVEKEQSRKDLWREYANLLRRSDDPKKGDEDRLLDLMPVLGLDARDVELHAAVVGDYDAAVAERASVERLEAELAKTRGREAKLRTEHAEIAKALETTCRQRNELTIEIGRIRSSDTVEILKHSHPGPLMGEDPETHVIPKPLQYKAPVPATARIQETMRRLGMRYERLPRHETDEQGRHATLVKDPLPVGQVPH